MSFCNLAIVDRGVVLGHVLFVQVLDFEDVDGDATVISATGPLGVL